MGRILESTHAMPPDAPGPDRPSTRPPQPDFVGRRFGEFVLRTYMGGGGFGAIYEAEQVGLGRHVVVKILHSWLNADAAARLRFLREARLAASLDHPYAAHVYASGVEDDGVLWIAMELVRGTPMDAVLREGAMPLPELAPFLERLCEVVETAHEHGIVHRDIKPQNVMVIRRAGALLPKLLDLGIAKGAIGVTQAQPPAPPPTPAVSDAVTRKEILRGEPTPTPLDSEPARGPRATRDDATPITDGASPLNVVSLTGEGGMMGSPPYMAPELWEGAELADAQSDIYALGVLAYEALVGRRPFVGTVEELAEQHMSAKIPALPEELPVQLYGVLARAMAKDPSDRPASALTFAREFRDAAGFDSPSSEGPRLPEEAVERALRDLPQPLAESIAELVTLRGGPSVIEGATRFARVTLRFLTVVALAAGDSAAPILPEAISLLSSLRRGTLRDDEWFDLLRALLEPFASRAEDHVVPELVRLVAASAPEDSLGCRFAPFFDRSRGRARASATGDSSALHEVATIVRATGDLLRALAFLRDYALAVVDSEGNAELWTGVRRKHRLVRPMDHAAAMEPAIEQAKKARIAAGELVLIPIAGRPLSLMPMAHVASPAPQAEREVFLLDGRGRRGLLLTAHPGGFEQTSETALSWLCRTCALGDDSNSTGESVGAPYRGLSPLTSADADIFFGREHEVEAFLNRLRTEPFLVVVGPSGAGKSSFVRAGVIPSLGESWAIVVLRPGAAPIATLIAKLARFGISTNGLSRETDPALVASLVHSAARDKGVTVLIVVDQFEELFTLTSDAAQRSAFCAWLTRMAERSSDPVRIVLTIRDDFLIKAQEERALAPRLAHAIELLSTPGAAELRRILVEPSRRAGFAFENDPLVDEMVGAVEGRAGALALLSFAALKLWEARDLEARTLPVAAYKAMGGVGGALAQHAEGLLSSMATRERALVREAFRRLVTAEGTRAVTRLDDLVSSLGGGDQGRAVTEQLVAARLLVVAENEEGIELVEVIHEALLAAWPRLVEWQQEDVQGSRLRDQIHAATAQWVSRGRPHALLWRGELLDDYRRVRGRGGVRGLTPTEEDFGRASVREDERGRRLRAGAVASVVVLSVLVTSFVGWQRSLATKAAALANERTVQAEAEKRNAEAANHRSERAAVRGRDGARLAAARLLDDDPTTQVALLREVEALDPPPGWASQLRAALRGGVSTVVLAAAPGERLATVAFSPDGQTVAMAGTEKTIQIWRADGTGTPTVLSGHTKSVPALAWSPDGRRLLSASVDGTVRIWSPSGESPPRVLGRQADGVYAVAWSPDGRKFAWGGADKVVRMANIDARSDDEPILLRGHTGVIVSLAWSPDSQSLASASRDDTIRIWHEGRATVLHDDTRFLSGIDWSPDGKTLLTSANDRTIRVWRADGQGRSRVVARQMREFDCVAFSPDGRLFAACGSDNLVHVWNRDGSGQPLVLSGHADIVSAVSWSADGKRLASASHDGTARIWNATSAPEPRVFTGHTDEVNSASFSPDGLRVASAGDDGTIRVWTADGTGSPLVLGHGGGALYNLAWSPDGRRIVTGGADHTARIWNADGTGSPLVFRGASDRVQSVAFSPDGEQFAACSYDGTARLWNADGKGEPRVFRANSERLFRVDFSPDGRSLAVASQDKSIHVWALDGAGGELVIRHPGDVYSVAWSPDGRHIASGGEDNVVRVWNRDGSGGPLALVGHTGDVWDVAWSPDSKRIVSSSTDKTIRLWNADGSGEAVVLGGHAGMVGSARFSPDGRSVVSASQDKTVRIWSDLAPLLLTSERPWQATTHCLSTEEEKRLLAVDDLLAEELRRRCLDRVAAAGPSLP